MALNVLLCSGNDALLQRVATTSECLRETLLLNPHKNYIRLLGVAFPFKRRRDWFSSCVGQYSMLEHQKLFFVVYTSSVP
jgi:hypothetical protein